MNDSLTYMLPRYEKVKISLGVLTQIRINDHNRISTSDTRIIRRMVRDQQFRDRGPMATMDIWADVRVAKKRTSIPIRKMPIRFSIRLCPMNCLSSSPMPNRSWNPSTRAVSITPKPAGSCGSSSPSRASTHPSYRPIRCCGNSSGQTEK